jgi:hypothetical protein
VAPRKKFPLRNLIGWIGLEPLWRQDRPVM